MDMIVMRRAQGAFGREKEGMNVLYMQIKKMNIHLFLPTLRRSICQRKRQGIVVLHQLQASSHEGDCEIERR